MKLKVFILAVLACMSGAHAYGQATNGKTKAKAKDHSQGLKQLTSTVEIINHPYYGAPGASTVKPLEKAIAGTKTKSKLLGYGGVSFLYQIQGEKSGFRILQTDSVSFLIHTAGGAMPELVLYKVTSEKGNRQATSATYKTFGGMQSGDNVIAFNVLSLTTGMYRIIPAQKLEPGEYFFAGKPVTGSASVDVYAFGID